jgi:hypothetical protein
LKFLNHQIKEGQILLTKLEASAKLNILSCLSMAFIDSYQNKG